MKNFLSILVIMVLLSGCYTQRKAAKQVLRAQATYPSLVAGDCALWYPPKDSVSIYTEYVPGATLWHYDTVITDCPPVPGDTVRVRIKVPCPPCPQRVDTVRQTVYKQEENTAALQAADARITALRSDLRHAQTEATKKEAGRNTWRIIALILTAYTVARWAFRYWLKINLP